MEPEWADLEIRWTDGDVGVRQLTITALQQQGEIDLEMELPRIIKLLQRDWKTNEKGDEDQQL